MRGDCKQLVYRKQGWVLISNMLSKVQVHRLKNKAKLITDEHMDTVFNGSAWLEDESNDCKRQQSAPFEDRMLQDVVKRVLVANGLWSDRVHRLDHFVMMRSLAGCSEQWPHSDYGRTFRHNDDIGVNRCPCELSLVLSLENGTKMVVGVGTRSEPKEIHIPVGSALVFHGGLVHAGAAYDQSNTRIHAYIGNTPDGAQVPNATYPLAERVSRSTAQWFTGKRRKMREKQLELGD